MTKWLRPPVLSTPAIEGRLGVIVDSDIGPVQDTESFVVSITIEFSDGGGRQAYNQYPGGPFDSTTVRSAIEGVLDIADALTWKGLIGKTVYAAYHHVGDEFPAGNDHLPSGRIIGIAVPPDANREQWRNSMHIA